MDVFASHIFSFFRSIRISDIIDILIVTFAIYTLMKFVRKTRAAQLIKGIGILLVVMIVSDWLRLSVVHFILINTMQIGATALLIIFQPELRRGLEHMGQSKFGSIFSNDEVRETAELVDEVCLAVASMSKTKTGALLVFERKGIIDEYLTGGTAINSDLSSEILENIFVPNTPLHDGAVIIKKERIHTAAAVLPLSSNKNLSKEFGTRHRASLGITEVSDSVALVVSEETGKISVAVGGDLIRNLSISSLNKLLNKLLSVPDAEKSGHGHIKSIFKGRDKE